MNSNCCVASILFLLLLLTIFYSQLLTPEQYQTQFPDKIYICTEGETSETNQKPACQIDKSTDYYGNSYQSTKADTYEQCCQLCLQQSDKCRSWTFDRDESICRLKTKYRANRSKCTHRISGYVEEPLKKEAKPSVSGQSSQSGQK